jgi:hypothetical protein
LEKLAARKLAVHVPAEIRTTGRRPSADSQSSIGLALASIAIAFASSTRPSPVSS